MSISPPPSPHLFYPPINIYKPHCNHKVWLVGGWVGVSVERHIQMYLEALLPSFVSVFATAMSDIERHPLIEPGSDNQVFPQGHWLINFQSLQDVSVCVCACNVCTHVYHTFPLPLFSRFASVYFLAIYNWRVFCLFFLITSPPAYVRA